ncbi:unnamed protein product [Rodentolepis nana]|uniref:Secreted protein n=1 Tax=Rodentolepis nana TaxID=102285 RepID=A0A0R3TSL1_RODNA|nr:unnamed protein product [Rodentolepis nana]
MPRLQRLLDSLDLALSTSIARISGDSNDLVPIFRSTSIMVAISVPELLPCFQNNDISVSFSQCHCEDETLERHVHRGCNKRAGAFAMNPEQRHTVSFS